MGVQRRYRSRVSIRMRLTITSTLLQMAAGGAVFVIIFGVLALIPGYSFTQGGYPGNWWPHYLVVINGRADVLALFLWVAIPSLLFVGIVGGVVSWFVAGRMLRPLNHVISVARTMDGSALDTRIALDGPQDEIKNLADTIDEMFARLQTAFDEQSRFAANASHELRTPLTTTKTLLQVALKSPQSEDTRQLLERLESTNTVTIQTTNALLEMASVEGVDHASFEYVDLGSVMASTLDAEVTAREALNISLSSRLEMTGIMGSPDLISIVCANLVQNSIRHNKPGGVLNVDVRETDGNGVITISNSGAVLSEDELGKLDEPFFRTQLRISRSAGERGYGLGLSLVKRIVTAHDGSLRIAGREPDGLTVTVTIPAIARSAPNILQ